MAKKEAAAAVPETITSVSLSKVPGDDFAWAVWIIKTEGDKVVSKEQYRNPDLRPIKEEHFKLAAVHYIFGGKKV